MCVSDQHTLRQVPYDTPEHAFMSMHSVEEAVPADHSLLAEGLDVLHMLPESSDKPL